MTKKAEKMVEKLVEKLNTTRFLYDAGYATFEETKDGIKKEIYDFDEMVSSMLHFGVISEKDFFALKQRSQMELWEEYHDIIWNLYRDKKMETEAAEQETEAAEQEKDVFVEVEVFVNEKSSNTMLINKAFTNVEDGLEWAKNTKERATNMALVTEKGLERYVTLADDTITMDEFRERAKHVDTFRIKDEFHPSGSRTVQADEVVQGDFVLIDNYFKLVTC